LGSISCPKICHAFFSPFFPFFSFLFFSFTKQGQGPHSQEASGTAFKAASNILLAKLDICPSINSNLDIYLFKFKNYILIPKNIKILDIYP
jgi:hypothetical protein